MSAAMSLVGARRCLVPPFPIKVAQIVTGYLVVRGIIGLIGRFLLGYGTECRVSWDGSHVRLKAETRLLGRQIRSLEETFLSKDVVTVAIEKRFPYLLLLLGALGTVIGAIVGLGWVFDGIEAHYVPIVLVGLGTLGLGVAIDVALGSVVDYLGGRVSLILSVRGGGLGHGRRIRVAGVQEDQARRFIDALAEVPGSSRDSGP